MQPVRLIIEPVPTAGDWNMAVDESLLESALAGERTTVRIYRWSAPTVSLGYFQDAEEFERDSQWQELAAVRRLSGGGAILHDREVTYSIALPGSHPLAAQPSGLYRVAHDAIIAVLARHGAHARMRGDAAATSDQRPATSDPFLCFGRGDPNDIVLGTYKIVGSAQRRRRGAILQHGSVLLERSPHAPEFSGLRELTGVTFDPEPFSVEVGSALATTLGEHAEGGLEPDELDRAATLQRKRYFALRWERGKD
ncbi:MAG: lipoate--protein ligase family protein [Planctomycetaceae bacterium]|nr:lipoate--protein ligase family protein [Planctomycetaceae bacterium]